MGGRGSLLLAGIVGLVLAAGGAWYAFFGGTEPPPVSLEAAVQGLQPSATPDAPPPRATASVVAATIPSASPSTSSAPSGSAPSGSAPSGSATPAAVSGSFRPRTDGRLEGRWAIDGGPSFVGYRVVEELARIGTNTAVGRTSAITGELTFDGRAVSGLRVAADVRQLKSDDNRRDNFLRNQSLQTASFPEATFVLAEPIAVVVSPAEGATMSAVARGDLTLHGVTRRVEVPIEGKLTGGKLVVVGSLKIAFADFGISPPRAPVVLSVEDVAVMELSLVFAPAEG